MNAALPSAILVLTIAAALTALAQDADGQTRSFGESTRLLTVGEEVKVKDEGGRGTRGRVVSISESHLVVARRQYPFPYFRPRVEQVFAGDVVRRIETVDSAWMPGGLIGSAAGVGLVASLAEFGCSPSPCDSGDKIITWIVGGVTFVPAGLVVGGLIDLLTNKTIYDAQSSAPRITVVPWFQRDRKGVMVGIGF